MAKPKQAATGAGQKFYRQENVYEMAKRRIAWLFDEFPDLYVSVSGGKDSTVLFHLALEVARAKGRLPLKLFWIDQEAEWQATVDITEQWMTHPDVEPLWLQVPFKIFNATSVTDHWLNAWDPADESKWMRPHHPLAITENVYKTDRFAELFAGAIRHHFGDGKACSLSGVRAEEARLRLMGLTYYANYKWVTWGAVQNKKLNQHTFYPLYDWSYTDIWKAIHENGWAYNRIYDLMFQRGASPRNMRVSNLHHETAVKSLFELQELEPDTYARLVARIEGIDAAAKFGEADYFPKTLPFMFSDWREYRDYLLLQHLVGDDYRPKLKHLFDQMDARPAPGFEEMIHKVQVNSILTNDHEGAKLDHVRWGNADYHRTQKQEHESNG